MVDPLEENVESLSQIRNGNIQFWAGALGRSEGVLNFHIHGNQSSMFSSEFKGEERKVALKTLDGLLSEKEISSVDAIKIDTQGAELEVLMGSVKALKTCRVIQLEVFFRKVYDKSPLAHEIVTCLSGYGFRIYDIVDIVKKTSDSVLLQADFFFVKDDVSLFGSETWS